MGRKWENIKRGKARLDAAKGATFSRLAKDIMKAAKEGGPDPGANIRLKTAVQSARESNMPTLNIERAIAKGAGLVEGVRYEHTVYEGYGPGGVAVTLNIVTDNRNRTAADMRHIFSKHGGNLGETGCVSWMFNKVGKIEIDRSRAGIGEDDLMMLVLEAGAEDLQATPEQFEITTAPEHLDAVLVALEQAKVPVERGELTMVPTTTALVQGEVAEKLLKMLDLLEEHEDVETVYTNAEVADAE